jgi:hypothetical protein
MSMPAQAGGRQVQCAQCLAMNWVPDGVDPHTLTWCQCCTRDHHHGQAAEACPGNGGIGHPGEPCPHPNPLACTVLTRTLATPVDLAPADGPAPAEPAPREPCPGGHCGAGVKGCTVCRPVIHFATAGPLQLGF